MRLFSSEMESKVDSQKWEIKDSFSQDKEALKKEHTKMKEKGMDGI